MRTPNEPKLQSISADYIPKMAAFKTTASWVLNDQKGVDGLQYVELLELPQVGENDVLVKIHAASLNYRDLAISRVRWVIFLASYYGRAQVMC